MSYQAGIVEYSFDFDTGALIDGRREFNRFGDQAEDVLDNVDKKSKKLNTSMKSLTKSVKAGLSPVASIAKGALAIAAGVAAASAAIVAFASSVANANMETKIMAEQSRLTVEQFKAMEIAASQYGITGEQIADISKDISDKLGEFSKVGTGAFQDFADVVGMTKEEAMSFAKEVENLSGRDVLIKMVSEMEKAGASSNQMVFALESMGNEASRLLPLLRGNGQELIELEKKYTKVGTSLEMTAEKSKELAKLNMAMTELKSGIEAAVAVVVADLSPMFIDFADSALKKVKELTGWILRFTQSMRGEEITYSLEEMEDQADETAKKIKGLQETLKEMNTPGTILSAGLSGESPDDIRKGIKELEKRHAALLKQIEIEKALIKQRQGDEEDNITGKTSGSGGSTGTPGVTADQKKAAEERLRLAQEYFDKEFRMTTDHLALLYEYKDDMMGTQIIAERKRHEQAITALEDRYTKERELAIKAGIEGVELETLQLNAEKAIQEEKFKNSQNLAEIENQRTEAIRKRVDSAKQYFKEEMEASIENDELAKQYKDQLLADEFIKEEEQHAAKMEKMQERFEEEKLFLEEAGVETNELQMALNEAETAELERHNAKILEIEERQAKLRESIVMQNYANMAGAASGFFGTMASIMDSGEKEQSSAYKAMFALQKGFAVAQAGLNFAMAISNASSLPWPTNIPAIATAVTQGTQFLSAVQGSNYSGGRRYGGDVSPGNTYEVNEAGVPEIVTAGNRDFLTMGNAGGKVTPLDKMNLGSQAPIINNYGSPDSVEAYNTDKGWVIDIAKKEAAKAAEGAYNKVVGDFSNNKGRVYDAASKNGNFRGQAGSGR